MSPLIVWLIVVPLAATFAGGVVLHRVRRFSLRLRARLSGRMPVDAAAGEWRWRCTPDSSSACLACGALREENAYLRAELSRACGAGPHRTPGRRA